MQKFRDYLYCDIEKVDSYYDQIKDIDPLLVSASSEFQSKVDGGLKVPVAKIDGSITAKNVENYSFSFNRLESFLDWVNTPGNVIEYIGQELTYKDNEFLIKVRGKIFFPDMLSNIELVNTFATNSSIIDSLDIDSDNKQVLSLLKKSQTIPVLLDCEGKYIFNFMLDKSKLSSESIDFYDNDDCEVTLIGRISLISNSEEQVEIFDMAKELFGINRTMRRKMPADVLNNCLIKENGPIVKLIPLILYK